MKIRSLPARKFEWIPKNRFHAERASADKNSVDANFPNPRGNLRSCLSAGCQLIANSTFRTEVAARLSAGAKQLDGLSPSPPKFLRRRRFAARFLLKMRHQTLLTGFKKDLLK